MHGIFTYIYHTNQPNVGEYTIHGWYGTCKTAHDKLWIESPFGTFRQVNQVGIQMLGVIGRLPWYIATQIIKVQILPAENKGKMFYPYTFCPA